jgi:BirA family biotin operon repressor/biotin-[acetyl-CoA-carboxylase] ligase
MPAAELAKRATSLLLALGQEIDRIALLQEFLRRLEFRYRQFVDQGLISQLEEIRQCSAVIGREISYKRAGVAAAGMAIDISPEGMLVVESEGKRLSLAAGEITLEGNY